MAGKTFSIEDVIADEVKRAVSSHAPSAAVTVAETAVGGGLGGLDIKGITGLLKEVNSMLSNRNSSPAVAPVAGTGPAPAGLPGVDNRPAQNPRPGPVPAGIEPEKVYTLVISSIDQIKAAIGDAKLSEVAEFMTGNKAVVVALIRQEIDKL